MISGSYSAMAYMHAILCHVGYVAAGDFKPVHATLCDDQSSVFQTRPQDKSSKIKAELESTCDLSDQVHMYYRFFTN